MSELMLKNGDAKAAPAPASTGLTFTPRFDVWETENEYILAGDLPGVAAEDVEIRYEDGELTIHGRVQPRRQPGRLVREEYGVGDFYRSFSLGKEIDAGAIAAELKLGVLAIRLPKRPEVRPRKIAVSAG